MSLTRKKYALVGAVAVAVAFIATGAVTDLAADTGSMSVECKLVAGICATLHYPEVCTPDYGCVPASSRDLPGKELTVE